MEIKKGHPYVRECGNIILPSLQHWNSEDCRWLPLWQTSLAYFLTYHLFMQKV